ncbi:MAG: GNAT family N-acetyltransferase [Tahibacter sp.]
MSMLPESPVPGALNADASDVRDKKLVPPAVAANHSLQPGDLSAQSPRWTHRLHCGTSVLIRPIDEQDAQLERRFIERLSPQSRRFRFLGQIASPSDETLRQLTQIDFTRDVAFVAVIHENNEKKEIGVARYGLAADGQSCECAVVVSDAWQNQGLGTLLMRHLIEIARQRGIRRMLSIDAADNGPMRDLAAHLGFARKSDPDDSAQVIHSLDL